MPRITAPERPAGDPRGRLLREAGACQDFEMRCVAPTASPTQVGRRGAPVFGPGQLKLNGAAGACPDHVADLEVAMATQVRSSPMGESRCGVSVI